MLYSKLKEKTQNEYRLKSYDDIFLSTLVSQLTYKNVPETVDTDFLEAYKLVEGTAAIFKDNNGNFISGHCNLGGKPYPNGYGSLAICSTDNGEVYTFNDWKNNKDVVVFFNNNIKTPDLTIGIFSDMANETDKSMLTLIKDSKDSHIVVTKSQKQKKALEECFTLLDDGKHAILLDDNILPNINDENGKALETLDLTDPTLSDKIQYLAKCRDDIFRWFYSLNGMNSQGSSKLAQQTTDEVNQDSAASMIIPDIRLKEAIKSINKCNEYWNWNAEVSLSECWMNRKATLDKEFSETDEELDDNEVDNNDNEVDNNEEEDL